MTRKPRISNSKDYEILILNLMRNKKWDAVLPENTNQEGYDISAVRRDPKTGKAMKVAVQVKAWNVGLKAPEIEKLTLWAQTKKAEEFDQIFVVAKSGYSEQAMAAFRAFEAEFPNRMKLGREKDGSIEWINSNLTQIKRRNDHYYIGVLTCKGGVGKTTVAAHLAGAMALSGYDVALLDLDPESNLSLLVGEGVTVRDTPSEPPRTVTVFKANEWVEDSQNPMTVVCDFSPNFSSNPERIIAKLSHIVIPTTLNPLGLNTHGRVVERTVEEIRKINKTAQIHVLINNYQPLDQKNILPKKILENYRSVFEPILKKDPLFNLIDPEECAIRYSKLLFYWGGHLFTGAKPGLALSEQRNTESNPRTDFLNLLEYFEEQHALKSSIVGTLKSVR